MPAAAASAAPGANFVALLTALTALGSISVSVYVPSLPAIAHEFNASPAAIKTTMTAFLVAFAAAQLCYGPVSDRFGRRPPILVGLIVYVIGCLACAAARDAPMLAMARIMQALGAGAGPALGRAMLRDRLEGARLASTLAVVSAAVALSPALGPVLGGFIQVWTGWRSGFVLLGIFGTALWLLCWRGLDESDTHLDPEALRPGQVAAHYLGLLGDRPYAAFLFAGGLVAACNFVWTAGAPFIFVQLLGFRPDSFGLANVGVGAGYVAGTLLVMRVATQFTPTRVLLAGSVLAFGGGAALAVVAVIAPSAVALIGAMAVVTLGMGIVVPTAAASALGRHPEMAGSAAALLGAGQIAVGAAATATLSALGTASTPLPMAALIAGCTALSLVSVVFAHQSNRAL